MSDKVAAAAAISTGLIMPWGHATVSLSTKKIKGLHENDFIMASKIDRLLDHPDGSLDHKQ
jgi:4a-hydroxytetrahydrobiopterin dehydratase